MSECKCGHFNCVSCAVQGNGFHKRDESVSSDQVLKFFEGFNSGKFPHQRVGQAFLNHFKFDCGPDHNEAGRHRDGRTCLFHELDGGKAVKRIWEEWVK